jgi:hypothetical protein
MDEMIQKMAVVLKELNIPYVLIGGIAASLLGKPRMTMDADVVIILADEGVNDLIVSMKKHGFSISVSSKPKIVQRLKRRLPVKLRYRKRYSIDLRLASYSIDHAAIRSAKQQILFDTKIPVVQAEELIVYKLVRFDEMDRADVHALLARHGKKLHVDYMEQLAIGLASEANNDDIMKNFYTVFPEHFNKEL